MTKTSGTINRQVEMRPVEQLIPYARNSRTHTDAQVAQIAASIREFGWTNPLLIDEVGTLIAGHGRLLAARQLGETHVPCIVLDGLTDAQKRALVITDNKLALNAGWDDALLAAELSDLKIEDFDLGLLGFNDDELASLFADRTAGLTDPDEVPEAPVEPVTVLGDVWLLGRHRIVCGDSTDAETVAKALNGVTPHLMVTDPPYGVNYDPSWRNVVKRRDGTFVGAKATGKVENDDKADWREVWALFPGDVAYVWHGGLHAATVSDSLAAAGFEIRSQIIWAKDQFVIGRGNYHWQHEPCWYAVRKGSKAHYSGDRTQSTIWKIPAPSGWAQKKEGPDAHQGIHSTQKMVECMKRPIENNSSPGQAVYEPFSGSGTTIIAGEMTGRCVHAIELNPAYVDVAVKRWQAFTALDAVHDETGKKFAEMKAERVKVSEAA